MPTIISRAKVPIGVFFSDFLLSVGCINIAFNY